MDYVPQKPQTHHPTVLDMMEVADLEVRNVLIDECRVDSVLLIEKRLEAERVIEVERPRGANVVSIYIEVFFFEIWNCFMSVVAMCKIIIKQ